VEVSASDERTSLLKKCILVKDLKILGSGFSSTICKLIFPNEIALTFNQALFVISLSFN
jgi:hypothetical protein